MRLWLIVFVCFCILWCIWLHSQNFHGKQILKSTGIEAEWDMWNCQWTTNGLLSRLSHIDTNILNIDIPQALVDIMLVQYWYVAQGGIEYFTSSFKVITTSYMRPNKWIKVPQYLLAWWWRYVWEFSWLTVCIAFKNAVCLHKTQGAHCFKNQASLFCRSL